MQSGGKTRTTASLGSFNLHLKTHSDSSETPFKCPECPFTSRRKPAVKKHVEQLHLLQSKSARPFPCPESGCNYAAKDKSTLKRHSKTHFEEKSLSCVFPNCEFSTNHQGSLASHSRIHTGERPFVCQFESCSYAAVRSSDLVNHTRTHTKEKPYKCSQPNCEFSSTSSTNVKQHQIRRHPKEGEERPSFPCPICEHLSKSKGDLTQHIQTHTLEKLFKCDEPNCNFEARTRKEIKMHKRVHSDEKPFFCSFESCEFRSKTKTDLSQHLKTHCEERPYKCELCPFLAKTRGVVRSHIKNVHSDPNFRPFKCTEPKCGSAFKSKGHLKEHLASHKGDKKYSCSFPDCSYRAISRGMIRAHEAKIHKT